MRFNLSIDDIKYVKILYANQDGSPVLLRAAIKKINEREICACAKLDDNTEIPSTQTVTLSIVCSEGLYRTKTKLKSCSAEEPYLFFYLETPEALEYQQNREYFRILAQYECIYYVKNGDTESSYKTTTVDLSANGVSILLSEHVFSEEDCEIDIMINEKLVHAKIKYVRSEKTDNGYRLSFTFSEISDKNRDYISGICIKKQLEQRRNNIV